MITADVINYRPMSIIPHIAFWYNQELKELLIFFRCKHKSLFVKYHTFIRYFTDYVIITKSEIIKYNN